MTTQEINTHCELHITSKGGTYRERMQKQYALEELGLSEKKATEFCEGINKANPPKRYWQYLKVEGKNRFYTWYYANHMSHYFENGFQSWRDAHHFITTYTNKYKNGDTDCVAWRAFNDKGMIGIRELAFQWTEEFEQIYRLQDWQFKDYLKSIFHFCDQKNYK